MDFLDSFDNLKNRVSNIESLSLDELNILLNDAKNIESEYDNLQQVIKANCNSLYGSCANEYFDLVDFDIAEDITTTAKHFAVIIDIGINNFFKSWNTPENLRIINEFYPNVKSLRNFTEYQAYTINDICVYGDTDSRYVDLERIYSLLILEDGSFMTIPEDDKEYSEFASFINEKFLKIVIDDTINEDLEFRGGEPGYLRMAHESTARKCTLIKAKNYIMTLIWEDGKLLKHPKLKYKGVAVKRGETSKKLKNAITKLIEKYMIEDYSLDKIRVECIKIINYIKHTKKKSLIYSVTRVSGMSEITVNNESFESDKNHLSRQVALSWMNFVKSNNLMYKNPFEGQKMNFYKCNPDTGYKVIGVPDDIDIDEVQGLPEPDWNIMLIQKLIKPVLRCMVDKKDITDTDCINFLNGVKRIKI